MGIDSTATDADILEPSDSCLWFDGVRVLTELLRQARERLAEASVGDHCRAAKRRHREIGSQRDVTDGERPTYRRLLRLVGRTIGYAQDTLALLEARCVTGTWIETWSAEVRRQLRLVKACDTADRAAGVQDRGLRHDCRFPGPREPRGLVAPAASIPTPRILPLRPTWSG